jgi:hypothetical protein
MLLTLNLNLLYTEHISGLTIEKMTRILLNGREKNGKRFLIPANLIIHFWEYPEHRIIIYLQSEPGERYIILTVMTGTNSLNLPIIRYGIPEYGLMELKYLFQVIRKVMIRQLFYMGNKKNCER